MRPRKEAQEQPGLGHRSQRRERGGGKVLPLHPRHPSCTPTTVCCASEGNRATEDQTNMAKVYTPTIMKDPKAPRALPPSHHRSIAFTNNAAIGAIANPITSSW